MPNIFANNTRVEDDIVLSFGDSDDFKIKYDSADNRLELLDSSDTVIGYFTDAAQYGSYTPTITGVANYTGSTPSTTHWTRVHNRVFVAGKVAITATANSTYTRLRISLPTASNLANDFELVGHSNSITSTNNNNFGFLFADTTNDAAEMRYISDSAAAGLSRTFFFSFSYIVI